MGRLDIVGQYHPKYHSLHGESARNVVRTIGNVLMTAAVPRAMGGEEE
jgi:hypothetical protein